MGLISKFMALMPLLLLLVSNATVDATSGVFDITTFGAKPNADATQALVDAWKEACASATPSKVLVPKGTYQLGESRLKGPCKSPIELLVEGTLQASPTDTEGDGLLVMEYVDHLTLAGTGVFDGQGKAGWEKNDCHLKKECKKLPMNLKFNFITNSIVKDITSLDSKNFHINVLAGKNLTFDHLKITAPHNSPNTDGIHLGDSEDVYILNTAIATGDDCVSVGYTNRKITISDVTCGPGHGISIGSLGKYKTEKEVVGVTVKKCKLIGTTNGVRIKSWPDSAVSYPASDMHFEDIEMDNVANPIIIDQEYCPWNQCNRKVPSAIKISKVSFKNIRGTSSTPVAVKLVCSKSNPCEDVEIADIDLTYSGKEGPIVSECANVKPTISGKQNPPICAKPAPPETTPSTD
ncbi:exopolygalacturonase-like [Cucurbita moschata]|uniref:Exopolygalacturonase-like n=1 Tax=Cucurbita moschata TaxID=3662 RepID=A0A6J1G454_CUCMO|nr:exopolygalacturonase-like [Cucurbita moschata]XP_022946597.1 exopolygalacturonase-like [Cucurbita moschata]